MSRRMRHGVVLAAVLGAVVIALRLPPVPQAPAYHDFADARSWMGIPRAANVLSNVPFALVGLMGLVVVFERRRPPFANAWERWPYAALFTGVLLTTVGSGYYHLAPDNPRLVWDRLPMTIGFMGLLTAIVAERIGVGAARWLFVPLVAAGALSVVYWGWSEGRGAGDLRPYFLVQFGSLLLVILLLVLYRGRYGGSAYVVTGLAIYAGAKVAEAADAPIFAIGQVVSGHTLKHLMAAAAVACLVVMLRARAHGLTSRDEGTSVRARSDDRDGALVRGRVASGGRPAMKTSRMAALRPDRS
jgi:hypothetical protein